MVASSKIGVVGSASSIGRILCKGLLPSAVEFKRGATTPTGRMLTSYQDIVPEDLSGLDVVVNCAGLTRGTPAELELANVDLIRGLANASRDAGVARMIHISSFSVYGNASNIGEGSPARPESAYGRSKLRGDEALLELSRPGFAPVALRLPTILNAMNPSGKVFALISAWQRIGWFPVPRGDVRRSMISTWLVARVIARLAGEDCTGIVHAADPVAFDFALAAKAIGGPARIVHLAPAMLLPLKLAAPGIYSSVYSDSLLDRQVNYSADMESDLESVLKSMASRKQS